jgi:hypothetical protein
MLATSSPATASSLPAKAPPEAGPKLAGAGLVWAAPRNAGGYAVAHALKGKVRTVATFARETGAAETLVPKLAASGDRVGLENGRRCVAARAAEVGSSRSASCRVGT